ncbi:hypothetical protein THRCLA_01742 [Thraustotheca clavata]|uniref:EF-hand domain-containing protein n=1 Tax=Thraustotheca clavata TaxID=74557 RepID=A0A1W0A7P9_9STRA|nr:hypothetical protein THRCLA_01742 [Thraustotheca clavata]
MNPVMKDNKKSLLNNHTPSKSQSSILQHTTDTKLFNRTSDEDSGREDNVLTSVQLEVSTEDNTETSNYFDDYLKVNLTKSACPESYRNLEMMNRSIIMKLREQEKLIERLKHDKASLENKVQILQQELQLKQQIHHTLLSTKERQHLPHLESGKSSNVRCPERPQKQALPGPRAVNSPRAEKTRDRIALTPTELREIQGLQLKVHNLESEKKKRTNEFSSQSNILLKKIQKLEQQLTTQEEKLREREAHIRMTEIGIVHKAQTIQGKYPTPRMLTDDLWSSIIPLKCQIDSSDKKSDVGTAFDELFSRKLLESLQRLPGHCTERWIEEVKETATKLTMLHRGFKALSGIFQRLSSCSDLYQLVGLIANEVKGLIDAEDAVVFVVDPFQSKEFWSRVQRENGDMVTMRFPIAPLSMSLQAAYHEFVTQSKTSNSSSHQCHGGTTASENMKILSRELIDAPPGFASYIYHSIESLNVHGCKILAHPLFCGDTNSTDRLMKLKSSSTILVPICVGDEKEPIAVLQVCGKMQKFRGMGVEVAIENCRHFTEEDQLLLIACANFCGGLLKKVISFTELETNRRSEYVLLSLSRQIFTCLDFKKLSMLVMRSTKELLDTDRCTLFVTKMISPTEQVLCAWQTDMANGSINFHEGSEIIVKFGEGIAGSCAELRSLVNVPDAYDDKRFNKTWDEKTKYRTKSILAVPIISSKGTLLGVIQMINKSGGTPFRGKDEEHVEIVAQLIALAMENSNLFQKTQNISKCIGSYISHLHLNEALLNLSLAAEDVVGVQCACIYLVDERTNELFTFHKTRKNRIDVRAATYKNSVMEEAMAKRDTVIVNNTGMCLHYSPAIDALNGIAAHEVMYVPLFQYGKNGLRDKTFIGLLHLVNRKGNEHDFDAEDSLVAIIVNQVSGILTSIMERQNMQQLHEDTKMLLETCMPFYKELNPLGVMNAVYNAVTSTFAIEKGHLWLFNEDKTSMWTPTLLPLEEMKFVNPSLRRRLSLSAKDRLEVSCAEGLLKGVIQDGKVVCVRRWDLVGDQGHKEGVQHITATDRSAKFTEYAITAAPVWDSFGIEVIGVLMLMYPRGRSLHRLELSKIPIFTRQITSALMVCREIAHHRHRSHRLESIIRGYGCEDLPPPMINSTMMYNASESYSSDHSAPDTFSLSIEIDVHGWLRTHSYPINFFSKGFSIKSRNELLRLPIDIYGNRHIIQVTNYPRGIFTKEHFDKWIGFDIAFGDWEKIKYDVHNAFSRKETLTAYYSRDRNIKRTKLLRESHGIVRHGSIEVKPDETRPLWDLSDHIRHEVAAFLWLFCSQDLKIAWNHVFAIFSAYDTDDSGQIDPIDFEVVLKGCGVHLNHHEYDALCMMFSIAIKPEKGTMVDIDGPYNVLELFQTLAPFFIKHIHFEHEIFPNLHATAHTVDSVHLLLSPTGLDCIKIPTL